MQRAPSTRARRRRPDIPDGQAAPEPGVVGRPAPNPPVPRVLEAAVVWRPVEALKPSGRNARSHSPKQLHQLAGAIQEFGFTAPILVAEDGTILAGHARREAARLLGMAEEVPTLRLTGLSPAQRRAYALADNRLAELAGWDREALALELGELVELGFEVELAGFETAEVDLLIGAAAEAADDAADDRQPAPDPGPAVSRLGDLWQLGDHRLLCADALDPACHERLLGGEPAQMVFADPPYNVPIAGHAGGLGAVRHRDFAMAAGEMRPAEFTRFLGRAFALLCQFSARASTHFVCMDWRHSHELLDAARGLYTPRNLCVWAKDNGGMGSLYRSQHELVWVFQNGTGRAINNVELGAKGRYRTNVWNYPGLNSLHPGRAGQLAMHPTVKPVALVADAILDCSRRGGLVLDPFAGSGTTIMAAERTGRRGCGIEIDPAYADVAVRRWQERTRRTAVLAGDGRSFAEVAAARQLAQSPA